MKRLLLALALSLGLNNCAPDHSVYYFVPAIELATGEIVSTNTLPLSSLAKCEQFAKEVYEPSVVSDPDVLAHSYACVKSDMKLKAPTEHPGMTKSTYGSI